MANMKDLLGAMLQSGMTESSARRIEHSLGEKGLGGSEGILGQLLGAGAKQKVPAEAGVAAESGGLFGALGDLAGALFGGGKQGQSLATGGLGALAGALLGGGGKSVKGAVGGGALALLGSLALQALRSATGQSAEIDSVSKLQAGLREPEDTQEEQEVHDIAELTVKAMLNAAKADGRIDEDEMQRIVGEMQGDGITSAEREFLLAETRKPMDTEAIVRAVPSPQVAAQVYAASLLAVEADTPAEQKYLQDLARDLKLNSSVVAQLRSSLNMN